MGSRIRYLHLPGNHFTISVSAKVVNCPCTLYVLRYSMLVPLSLGSLSRSTRPKFIVLFPCIARAEIVIATILYRLHSAPPDCFAVYYCSIYIFLEWRHILFTDTGMPAQENSRLAFNWTGAYPAEKF